MMIVMLTRMLFVTEVIMRAQMVLVMMMMLTIKIMIVIMIKVKATVMNGDGAYVGEDDGDNGLQLNVTDDVIL
jgi:hypothetical protein